MTSSTQIELLNQFAKELNQGNIASVRQYMSADYFNYSPKEKEPRAYDVYFAILSDIKAAVSDLHIELADLNVEDDLITGVMKMPVSAFTTGQGGEKC